MKLKKKAPLQGSKILNYMDDWEQRIDAHIQEGTTEEYKDMNHYLFEATVEAIYENPQDFWDKYNKTLY